MHHLMHLLLHSGQFLCGSHTGSHVNHVGLGQKVSPFFGGRKETPTIFDCKALEDDSFSQSFWNDALFFNKKWDQQNQTDKRLISGEICGSFPKSPDLLHAPPERCCLVPCDPSAMIGHAGHETTAPLCSMDW